jgi:hypothetical protein
MAADGGCLMPLEGAGDVEAGLAELLARPVELPPMSATTTAITEPVVDPPPGPLCDCGPADQRP